MHGMNQTAVHLLLAAAAAAFAQPPDADHAARMEAGTKLFAASVRPALVEHCLRCHGDGKVRGDLDWSSRERLLQGGESGPAIDLERPAQSLVLKLLRHTETPHMPFRKPRLPARTIADFARWIELGAPYDKPLLDKASGAHGAMRVTEADREIWAFAPLQAVAPPAVESDWPANDIDRFVLRRLREHKLGPSPAAPRAVLVRRTYFDLVGLPPTPEQMRRALAMSHRELVDQLLASPHYGERWGRHWLDAARFAESHGFEQDYNRAHAYHYRDFVIQALNRDMPYDQFVRWQIAGDEFAPDNTLAMMATGFLGAGAFPTQLTEKEFERARYDELDDMLQTTGNAMLGLTIGCARCHDHKTDPIPAEDYYSLLSSFTTTIRSEIDLEFDSPDTAAAMADWEAKRQQAKAALDAHEQDPETRKRFDAWLRGDALAARQKSGWSVLDFARMQSASGATLSPQPDGSVLVGGANPASDTYRFQTRPAAHAWRVLRIEALTHESLNRGGPGRAGNGNFALSDLKAFVRAAPDQKEWKPIGLTRPRATHQQNQDNLSVASAIDGEPKRTGWAVDFGGIGKDQAATFAFAEPVAAGTELKLELTFANNGQHALGRPRISVSADPEAPVTVGDGQSAGLRAAFAALENGALQPEHRAALFPLHAATDPEWNRLHAALQATLAAKPKRTVRKVQVSSEGLPHIKHHADGRGYPHFYPETHVLKRGDPNQKQGVASQGFLQVLMRNGKTVEHWREPPPDGSRTSYRRRTMANWMTDTEDGAGHLLARVIVNRLWHHHFGRGIVATPNDFGLQGEPPSHPELLDFLARRLIDSGWRLKSLHRDILTSATWQQASDRDPAAAAADPANQWIWRHSPRRLEAEILRDAMLSVSGQLDPTQFGPGTLDESMRRRSIYFMIKRSKLVPMMQVFDQPEPLVSQGRRPSTTIAPQALLFMNNPQVVKWARALAAAIDRPELADSIDEAYQRCLCRPPTLGERRRAIAFVESQTATYSKDARQLALADFCQALFGLNEFAYIQ